ncbi:hypothetical protein [uncultured Phenylobacterium sp.]|uniref:hypothetical protein n=1 Tax=uncultured Phenylobacterium sp. TaxID=349273 RepID=UPI0025F7FCC6|nr:hypothetical protein [uncultured Phenylobacterium sp.]
MSSISSAASVASQPPITYAPPAPRDDTQAVKKDEAKTAEKSAKVDDVAATAVKSQATKAAGTGVVLDIQA